MNRKWEGVVEVQAGPVNLEGFLTIPEKTLGLVVFVHGSGSSRLSPRNQYVANVLNERGMATLLFDLLTQEEEVVDIETRHLRFDIDLLAERVVGATNWLEKEEKTKGFKIGYFGASTGAAAALVATQMKKDRIAAVVSRGGRPDLAGSVLSKVQAPTLLIVGELDFVVLELNQEALKLLPGKKKLEIVPKATHLFEESGTLEQAASLAASWFIESFGA